MIINKFSIATIFNWFSVNFILNLIKLNQAQIFKADLSQKQVLNIKFLNCRYSLPHCDRAGTWDASASKKETFSKLHKNN